LRPGFFFRLVLAVAETWKTNGPTGSFDVKVSGAEAPAPVLTTVDVVPKSGLKPNAEFPSSMDDFVGEAMVWVDFTVTAPEGKARNVTVLKATHPEFGEALVAATEAGDFVPATKLGTPVAATISLERPFDTHAMPGPKAKQHEQMLTLLETSPEKIVTAKKLDAPLKPVVQRAPGFPGSAKSEDGTAVVEVIIDKDGRVLMPKIISASQPSLGVCGGAGGGRLGFRKADLRGKASGRARADTV
jgi:hypothetical protein